MMGLIGDIPDDVLQLVDDVRVGRLELASAEAAALRAWLEVDPARREWFNEEIEFDFWVQFSARQLPVPAELPARILATVRSRQREMETVNRTARLPRRTTVWARAKLLFSSKNVQFGLGVATALLVLVGAFVMWPEGRNRRSAAREPLDAVIVKSVEWFEELMADDNWEESFHQFMSEYPLDDILPRQPRRARPFQGNWGIGMVYDLTEPTLTGALLFVVRPSKPYEDRGRLPTQPVYVDSRHSVGAGEHNGLVYILVVRGNPRDYHVLFMTSLTGE